MTLLHSELCFSDFRSPSFCSALSPKEGFGREVGFRKVRSPPVGILSWSSAGGRRDGPRNLKGPARSWAASCRGSAFLQQLSRGPVLLPLYQGRSALKAACSSLKKLKKGLSPQCLVCIITGEDCVPTAGQPEHRAVLSLSVSKSYALGEVSVLSGDATGNTGPDQPVLRSWRVGTVISIPSPATWMLQDGSFIIVLHVLLGNLSSRIYAHLGERQLPTSEFPHNLCGQKIMPKHGSRWRSSCVCAAISLHAERK